MLIRSGDGYGGAAGSGDGGVGRAAGWDSGVGSERNDGLPNIESRWIDLRL